MANTLSGFKVIGDTSKIGAGSKKGSAGQTRTAPSSNGGSRTLGGFKVIGNTSKIGAKAAAKTAEKTTQQKSAQSAAPLPAVHGQCREANRDQQPLACEHAEKRDTYPLP